MATHAAAIVAVTRAIRIQVTPASLADELLEHADVCVPRKFDGRLARSRLALPFVFHCHLQLEPNHLQARQGPAGEHTLGQEAFIEDTVICLGFMERGSLQFQSPLRILSLPSFMHDDVRGHPVQGALVGTPGGEHLRHRLGDSKHVVATITVGFTFHHCALHRQLLRHHRH
eukprot:CAMPEP_0177156316 /NCGR_PEP_ID=MMETSP0367-20130122/2663_1 /TAXON_ID=447022 ORGANISM="Scrippsiella hangoei-like, Strain SHHI-4" /NCGR_SAMPLE_ID=MMETSP0367 /ASSEMBLY_ACC=CAM_ASM_000362 /LENGTH=171 /DNA_ID=CAMNT_0018601765 /DNA_START=153 /DNA_END=669 /DNA_ORIENTATION=+